MVESAIKRFKRLVQRENIIREYKQHMFYLRPGERDRVKRSIAQKRRSKHMRIAAGRRTSSRPEGNYHRRPELPPIAFEGWVGAGKQQAPAE